MTEIICISCWQSFEVDEAALDRGEVTCPSCGFAQPGVGPTLPSASEAGGSDGLGKAASGTAPAGRGAAAGGTSAASATAAAPQAAAAPAASPSPPREPRAGHAGGNGEGSYPMASEPAEVEPPPVPGGDGNSGASEEPPPLPVADPAEEPPPDPFAAAGGDEEPPPDPFAAAGGDEELPADPFQEMEEVLDLDAGGDAPTAEGASEEERPARGDDPDKLWWVRSPAGLDFAFPTLALAQRWVNTRDPTNVLLARSSTAFRRWPDFEEALRRERDPDAAFDATPAVETGARPAETAEASPPVAEPAPEAPATEAPPASSGPPPAASLTAGGSPPASSPSAPSSEQGSSSSSSHRHRSSYAAVTTSEFTFRTGSTGSSWGERLLFLGLGAVLGGGIVYYLAWLGLMPGILY